MIYYVHKMKQRETTATKTTRQCLLIQETVSTDQGRQPGRKKTKGEQPMKETTMKMRSTSKPHHLPAYGTWQINTEREDKEDEAGN